MADSEYAQRLKSGGDDVNNAETKLVVQWFEVVQDIAHPTYLAKRDYALVARLLKLLGRRVPKSIAKHLPNEDVCQ